MLNLPDQVCGSNPVVMAANPVLNLVPQIRNTAQLNDAAQLREFLISKVQGFEKTARGLGVSPESIVGARYCLCTLLDESAAQTPWGGSGVWSRHSLLVTFHNETWGGEKFFQLLSKLAQNPQQHRDLLELMYYCLSLGLEGRFRVVDNGRAQLETLRQRLWTILRDIGDAARDDRLSAHWKGASGGEARGWRLLPAWVVACLAAVIGLGCFLWFTFSLATQPGLVEVSGYTDNQPIRTARYPSNFELSRERAEQVAAYLKSRGVAAERLRSQGLGDAQAIADNNVPDGRARNRRVEVVLFAAPSAVAIAPEVKP